MKQSQLPTMLTINTKFIPSFIYRHAKSLNTKPKSGLHILIITKLMSQLFGVSKIWIPDYLVDPAKARN